MRLLLVLMTALLLWQPTSAQPLYSSAPTGVEQSLITNTTASIPSSSTTVTLVAPSRHIIIKTETTSAILYLDLAGGTATTADFLIAPGAALTYEGLPLSSFKIIGASATGTYSVLAW